MAFLDARHRAHARVEDRIRTAKDTGLEHFPSRTFAINSAWLAVVMLAVDLLAWTGHLLLHGELAKAEPKTLRYRLLHVAARITRGQRRTWVRIQQGTRPPGRPCVIFYGKDGDLTGPDREVASGTMPAATAAADPAGGQVCPPRVPGRAAICVPPGLVPRAPGHGRAADRHGTCLLQAAGVLRGQPADPLGRDRQPGQRPVRAARAGRDVSDEGAQPGILPAGAVDGLVDL